MDFNRGPQFMSTLWKFFCSALGSKVGLMYRFYPQSNGQTKQANQELEAALCCTAVTNQTTWSSQLPCKEQ